MDRPLRLSPEALDRALEAAAGVVERFSRDSPPMVCQSVKMNHSLRNVDKHTDPHQFPELYCMSRLGGIEGGGGGGTQGSYRDIPTK